MKLIDLLAVSGWRIVSSSIKMNPNVLHKRHIMYDKTPENPLKKKNWNLYLSLTHLEPMFYFYTPENIRKLEIF